MKISRRGLLGVFAAAPVAANTRGYKSHKSESVWSVSMVTTTSPKTFVKISDVSGPPRKGDPIKGLPIVNISFFAKNDDYVLGQLFKDYQSSRITRRYRIEHPLRSTEIEGIVSGFQQDFTTGRIQVTISGYVVSRY